MPPASSGVTAQKRPPPHKWKGLVGSVPLRFSSPGSQTVHCIFPVLGSRMRNMHPTLYLSGRPLRPGTATVLRAHPQTRLVSQCAGPSLNLSYRLCLKKKSFGKGWVGDTLGIPQEDVGLQSIEEHMPLIQSCLQGRRPSMPDSAVENAWGW